MRKNFMKDERKSKRMKFKKKESGQADKVSQS